MHKQSLSTGIASTPNEAHRVQMAAGWWLMRHSPSAKKHTCLMRSQLQAWEIVGTLRGYTESVVFCAHARSRRQGAVL